MGYLDRLGQAVDQHASGVTGDQTSPWDRANPYRTDSEGNPQGSLVEVGRVYTRWWDSASHAFDNPLLKNPDGTDRPFSSLDTGQQIAVVTRTASNLAGAAMGLLGSFQDALNVGFANLTAPLAAIWPSFPASTLTSLYVGSPHGHQHPPSYVPAPPTPGAVIPLPSLGNVLVGNHLKTLIGSLPAARCGDIGIAPTCVGITPFFEIKTGSSNVFIGGKRAARMLDICRCCNSSSPMSKVDKVMAGMGVAVGALAIAADVSELAVADSGMVDAKALSAAMNSAQMAADAAAMAVQNMLGKDEARIPGPGPTGVGPMPVYGAVTLGTPLVLIGGFPMVNIPDPVSLLLNKLAALRAKKGGPGDSDAHAAKSKC
jgi:uncharacterized Zn-binding protein involved in type VI secretion